MKLTEELIRKGLTKGLGLAGGQLRPFGIQQKKGWLQSLVGREVSLEAYEKFLAIGEARREKKKLGKASAHKKKRGGKRKKTKKSIAKAQSDAFLKSYEWRKLRLVVIKKYGRKCQCCGATPETGAVIHVDHIKPRKHYPELALDEDNLQVLCHECNHGKGNWDETDFRQPAEVDIEEELDRQQLADLQDKGWLQ